MARSSTSSAVELLLRLRRDGTAPLHGQLERELRDAIRDVRLGAGTALPSTRSLAEELGVSRGVVVEAYEQLAAEGYLATRQGGVTRVAPGAVTAPAPTPRTVAPAHRIDFRYGRSDVSLFPRPAWLRSLKRVLLEAPNERLSYLDPRGAPELKEALAGYLNRVRGTAAHDGHVVITTGYAQGLAIVARVLRARGATRLAVEDPSESDARETIRSAGLEVVGIPVDRSGIRVETLDRAGADAVVVTPAHQFPSGAVLPAERRAALVAWATTRNTLIVEDDYDAEFRYDRDPIGAIQGLASDRVIYAGSASKTLAPGLRLGWLLAPGRLVEPLAAAKFAADRGTPSIEQLAFADFLERGEFDRHLRRVRPIYRGRRDRLLRALAHHLPELQPVGASAGLHVLAWLPDGVDERQVVEQAAQRGLGVYGLGACWMTPSEGQHGLLFGYAALSESAIDEGVGILREAVAAAPRRS
jgi:GntR family transcriptional regulator/MocR family aminotransferase